MQGSSHSWSPVFGWAKAYPETTGYLVETLRAYAALKNDPKLDELADQCVAWLLTTQLPGGSFPALLAGSGKPSIFNTAMVLFGLGAPLSSPTPRDHSKKEYAVDAALQYLFGALSPDGVWRIDAYIPGFVPSYYTRAVWGVLSTHRMAEYPGAEDAMRNALRYYAGRFLPNGAVQNWGFQPGKAAFTHTIAYTLEGFLESAILLGETLIFEKTVASATALCQQIQKQGRSAGRYDENWRGDYSFLCVTGNAQLSVLFQRLWALTGEPTFEQMSQFVLWEILDFQSLESKNKNRSGALAGRAPLWGPYLRMRYPNWAAKFFLDAMSAFQISSDAALKNTTHLL